MMVDALAVAVLDVSDGLEDASEDVEESDEVGDSEDAAAPAPYSSIPKSVRKSSTWLAWSLVLPALCTVMSESSNPADSSCDFVSVASCFQVF